MLVMMSGLPGSGKSVLAYGLARALPAVVLSVDPIESAIRRAGVGATQPTGLAAYVVADAVAEDNLRNGLTVVVDAVNDAAEARQQWRELAMRAAVPLRIVEVVCSDVTVHRRRLSDRQRGLAFVDEPSWESAQRRRSGFAGWDDERLVLDTVEPLAVLVERALAYLRDH